MHRVKARFGHAREGLAGRHVDLSPRGGLERRDRAAREGRGGAGVAGQAARVARQIHRVADADGLRRGHVGGEVFQCLVHERQVARLQGKRVPRRIERGRQHEGSAAAELSLGKGHGFVIVARKHGVVVDSGESSIAEHLRR